MKYKGKEYLTRDLLVVDEDGDEFTIVIGTESLSEAIIPDGIYKDIEGEAIDQSIYYYIGDESMEYLEEQTDEEFARFCNKYVDLGGLKPVLLKDEEYNGRIRLGL